mmetsp:Transcript_26023/g.85560  ORF Transcript_26023/g.85560 Transcript_26023/m.85560 type:complete len:211 (+) Transcript_26023:556-1188(+)
MQFIAACCTPSAKPAVTACRRESPSASPSLPMYRSRSGASSVKACAVRTLVTASLAVKLARSTSTFTLPARSALNECWSTMKPTSTGKHASITSVSFHPAVKAMVMPKTKDEMLRTTKPVRSVSKPFTIVASFSSLAQICPEVLPGRSNQPASCRSTERNTVCRTLVVRWTPVPSNPEQAMKKDTRLAMPLRRKMTAQKRTSARISSFGR